MKDDSSVRVLAQMAASLFDVEIGEVSEATGAGEIDSWDSLGHLQFVMEIEQHFGVRFKTEQIPELTSIAAILAALEEA